MRFPDETTVPTAAEARIQRPVVDASTDEPTAPRPAPRPLRPPVKAAATGRTQAYRPWRLSWWALVGGALGLFLALVLTRLAP